MPPKIEFATVDVTGPRRRLEKRVNSGEKIPFTIHGYLDQPQNDDGVSQEYACQVTDFTIDLTPTSPPASAEREGVEPRGRPMTHPNGITARPHREIGSVEGYIKTVGRDGFGRPVLTLTTRVDGNDIKCVSSDGGLDKIGHLEVGKVIRGMRIRAHGLLLYKSPELLERVEVERVEMFEQKDSLPELQELIDPEFTGGIEAVEYIRMRRDNA